MAEVTKIFLSSAADPEFENLRIEIKNSLEEMEHRVLNFEHNFGPIGRDAIQTYLDRVSDSDVYLLFIGRRAGSYIQNEGRTTTHLEFEQAYNENKQIYVLVSDFIKDYYFSTIKPCIDRFWSVYDRMPLSSFKDEFLPYLESQIDVNAHGVEPYVWFFLTDLFNKKIYFESFNIENPEYFSRLRKYLSDDLRRGYRYLVKEDEIKEQLVLAESYPKLQRIVFSLTELLENGRIYDLSRFLTILRDELDGGRIVYSSRQYAAPTLGTYRRCCGITLYQHVNGKMRLIKKEGNIGERTVSSSKESDSYLADTLKTNDNVLSYYQETQMLCFMLSKGLYALCFHYPLEDQWDDGDFKQYQGDVKHALMNSPTYHICLFAVNLLAGMKSILDEDI